MNKALRATATVVNKAIRPLGVQITRAQPSYGSLDIYSEITRPSPPAYVNIGAGSFYHPFWHNLDTPNDFYATSQRGNLHIQHDLTSGLSLPFASDSLKAVYISHVIEHLADEHVLHCFSEVHRCLRPGGFFRITCPDMDFEYEAYCRGDITVWMWPTPWGTHSITIEQRFLEHVATILTTKQTDTSCQQFTDEEIRAVFSKLPKEEALQYFVDQIPDHLKTVYPEYHVNWFNVQKIENHLRLAGFEVIYESKYGQSKSPFMRNKQLFDSTVPEISLYVECQK